MLPNLVVIGAPRCGTTAMHYSLELHPEISMSLEKEPHFFVEEVNWGRGVEWYEARFDQAAAAEATVLGEASPNYANYPFYERVPERMHSVIPAAKLIYMVRDPVDRIISHHRFEQARTRQEWPPPAESSLKHFKTRFVRQSMYCFQLRRFTEFFQVSQVLVLAQEDLASDREAAMRRVFEFLEVEPGFDHPSMSEPRNTSEYCEIRMFGNVVAPPEIDDELKQRLIEHLRGDIDEFRAWVGQDFEGWSV